MSNYFIQPLDPTELANRFCTTDALMPLPDGPDDEWKAEHLERIRGVIDYLPDREADLISLYFFFNKKQTDIAEIFGITQAAVSYRIRRAIERIKFLVEMPTLTKEEIFDCLIGVFPTKTDVHIFQEMLDTTCQSETAERLGISQGRVRHRFLTNLKHLGVVVAERVDGWLSSDHVPDPDLSSDKILEAQTLLQALIGNNTPMEAVAFENSLKDVLALTYEVGLNPDLEEPLSKLVSIYLIFLKIRYNFNILREVKLPKWSGRSGHVLT